MIKQIISAWAMSQQTASPVAPAASPVKLKPQSLLLLEDAKADNAIVHFSEYESFAICARPNSFFVLKLDAPDEMSFEQLQELNDLLTKVIDDCLPANPYDSCDDPF